MAGKDGAPLFVLIAVPIAGVILITVLVTIVVCYCYRRRNKTQKHRVSKRYKEGTVNAAYTHDISNSLPVALAKSKCEPIVINNVRNDFKIQPQRLGDSETTNSGDSGFGDNDDISQETKKQSSDSLEEVMKNYPRHDSECEFCTIGSFYKSQTGCGNPNCQRQISVESAGSYYVNVRSSSTRNNSTEKQDVIYCNENEEKEGNFVNRAAKAESDTDDVTYDHIDLKHVDGKQANQTVTHTVMIHNESESNNDNEYNHLDLNKSAKHSPRDKHSEQSLHICESRVSAENKLAPDNDVSQSKLKRAAHAQNLETTTRDCDIEKNCSLTCDNETNPKIWKKLSFAGSTNNDSCIKNYSDQQENCERKITLNNETNDDLYGRQYFILKPVNGPTTEQPESHDYFILEKEF